MAKSPSFGKIRPGVLQWGGYDVSGCSAKASARDFMNELPSHETDDPPMKTPKGAATRKAGDPLARRTCRERVLISG
jgi:hypothetical protein